MTHCLFTFAGHVWGFGENMENMYIITEGIVEVMFLPRVQFSRHNKLHTLIPERDHLDDFLPDNQALLKLYFEGMRKNEAHSQKMLPKN